jgi:Xaa-Pro dipeptidase
MWYCAYVASQAHVAVMRSTKVGQMEFELEATFLYEIYKNGGCRRAAYTSICACGPNAAVLHYGHAAAPNDRQIQSNDIALLDMGAEYHNYVSDITCSFPVSGKFTADQRVIFTSLTIILIL